jgi:hypothetical protein
LLKYIRNVVLFRLKCDNFVKLHSSEISIGQRTNYG